MALGLWLCWARKRCSSKETILFNAKHAKIAEVRKDFWGSCPFFACIWRWLHGLGVHLATDSPFVDRKPLTDIIRRAFPLPHPIAHRTIVRQDGTGPHCGGR